MTTTGCKIESPCRPLGPHSSPAPPLPFAPCGGGNGNTVGEERTYNEDEIDGQCDLGVWRVTDLPRIVRPKLLKWHMESANVLAACHLADPGVVDGKWPRFTEQSILLGPKQSSRSADAEAPLLLGGGRGDWGWIG